MKWSSSVFLYVGVEVISQDRHSLFIVLCLSEWQSAVYYSSSLDGVLVHHSHLNSSKITLLRFLSLFLVFFTGLLLLLWFREVGEMGLRGWCIQSTSARPYFVAKPACGCGGLLCNEARPFEGDQEKHHHQLSKAT